MWGRRSSKISHTFTQIKFISILVAKKIEYTDWLDPSVPSLQQCQSWRWVNSVKICDCEIREEEEMETGEIHYSL